MIRIFAALLAALLCIGARAATDAERSAFIAQAMSEQDNATRTCLNNGLRTSFAFVSMAKRKASVEEAKDWLMRDVTDEPLRSQRAQQLEAWTKGQSAGDVAALGFVGCLANNKVADVLGPLTRACFNFSMVAAQAQLNRLAGLSSEASMKNLQANFGQRIPEVMLAKVNTMIDSGDGEPSQYLAQRQLFTECVAGADKPGPAMTDADVANALGDCMAVESIQLPMTRDKAPRQQLIGRMKRIADAFSSKDASDQRVKARYAQLQGLMDQTQQGTEQEKGEKSVKLLGFLQNQSSLCADFMQRNAARFDAKLAAVGGSH